MITEFRKLDFSHPMKENVYVLADCMEVMKAMPDNYIDLCITDPVYGGVTQGGYMKEQGGKRVGHELADRRIYHQSIWAQDKTPKAYFDELFRVSKAQIIWGGNYFSTSINKDSQGWIVWDKKRSEGVGFADGELAWTSFNKALRIFRYKWDGMLQENMKNKEHRIHPCHKPIALYEWILRNYAKPGDVILDTHVGSASSLIACERLGFRFIGCEIDEEYYKSSLKRFEQETAQMTLFNMGLDS